MAMDRAPKNLLLTGPPGCGKTTLIRRIVGRLENRRLAGFFTQEIRQHGQRVGFEAVGLHRQVIHRPLGQNHRSMLLLLLGHHAIVRIG